MTKRPTPPNRISQIRKHRSLSQQELGDLVGAHFVTISKLETGKLPLTQEWLTRIASALRVDPSEIAPGSQKRKIYVTGTIEGSARIDVWSYKESEEKLSIETDLYAGDGDWVQWLIVNGDALYPVFQHLDILQILYKRPIDMRELQGCLCAVQTDEQRNGPVVYLGIPTQNYGDDIFDIHLLNGAPLRRQKIINIARVSAAIFKPPISDDEFKHFQDIYVPFANESDHPRYSNIADWLKNA